MKIVKIFENEVEVESINDIMQDISIIKDEDEIDVYFNSPGGSLSVARVFKDFLKNTNKSVTLIANGEISSSAFFIFFGKYPINIKQKILNNTYGIMHYGSIELNTRLIKQVGAYDYFLNETLRNDNEEIEYFLKDIGFEPNELNELYKNKNIYLPYDRLVEFLENIKEN